VTFSMHRFVAWGQAAALMALALVALPLPQVAAQKTKTKTKAAPPAAAAPAAAPAATPARPSQGAAGGAKPVAVVSLSSIEETLADIGYVTRAAGAEDAGRTAILLGNAFTNGLDKKRPMGMYVVQSAGEFQGVAFIPVTDIKIVFETFKEQVGEPKDVGDGILEIGTAQTAYVKEVDGWAFVSQNKDHLVKLPADPAAMLGKLPSQYNVAVRVMSQNFDPQLKKLAIDEMKAGFERGLDNANTDVDPEVAEAVGRQVLGDMEDLINDSDELLVGLAIDSQTKKTYLDISLTAIEGSNLAKQMASLQEAKTAFSGFLMDDAAVTFNLSSRLTAQDIKKIQPMLKQLREQAMEEIDNDPDLAADKRDAAKAVVGKFITVLDQTIAAGRIDGGAALVLEPESIAFASGALVADGKALEDAVKELVELAKDEPEFPSVKLNAAKHGGVTFHRLTAPIPEDEEDARELFGETIDIVLGTSGKSVYLAFGDECEELLKEVIDASAEQSSAAVPPFQLNIALLPILKFADSVDDNPIVPALVEMLEKAGNDRISVIVKPIPRGAQYRVEVQEGVLQVIGEAGKRFSGGLNNGL
jgi:hypothetical protein